MKLVGLESVEHTQIFSYFIIHLHASFGFSISTTTEILFFFLSIIVTTKDVLLGFSINMSAKDVLSGGSDNMTAMANATDVLFGFEFELLRAQPCWFTLN